MEQRQQHRTPPDAEVRASLQRIVASLVFANSARLQDFLTYIVEEKIAGRGGAIKGKTVAVAVYGREIDEAGSAQNLVRVEARRLRRALDEFYATEGQSEPLRITVKAGSYTPSFDTIAARDEAEQISRTETVDAHHADARYPHFAPRTGLILSVGLVAVLVFMAGAALVRDAPRAADGPVAERQPLRAALKERSVASVQSYNIAQQARGIFFPLFDTTRQEIALSTFRHAIDLDPDLPSGYAGAAQVLALQSFLSPDAVTAADLFTQAEEMAARGLELGPTDAWALAANAWTLAVEGKVEAAIDQARIAFELSPEDGHTLDLIGLTALVSGDAVLLAQVSDPSRKRSGEGRFGANSLWGTSQLMLENYPATVEAFSSAAERGLPVSAPSLLLLATAYNASGDEDMAEKNIVQMMETWPGFPVEYVATLFFARDPDTRDKVLQTYQAHADRD